ncbi:tyrosine-type recombinase/integrase [Candidatus Clostridium radicumherbarum]|uniref:Tyrosine-type recombinase/integrase n=1 Tax=Candidatus Clostridium radicumherbarum TaxID=3381662 RepID=A0ABW8TXJ5_9CLOT
MDKKDYYISDFIDFLKENDKAGGTIKTYTDNLYLFIKYYCETYGEVFSPERVISIDLQDWRTLQINHGLKGNTINNRIIAVKEYFTFLELSGVCKNPAKAIKKIKVNNTSPIERTFTNKQFKAIKRAIYRGGNPLDILLLELFSKSGLRISEAINLKLDDISIGERSGTLRILGKEMKERYIPLNVDIRKTINDYLPVRNKKFKDSPFLLVSERGMKFTRSGLYKRFLKYQNITGMQIHPNMFRSLFATHIVKYNPLNYAMQLLGHSSISTTQTYLSPENEDLENAIKTLDDL